MAISQSKIHEAALIILYSVEMNACPTEEIIPLVMSTLSISKTHATTSNILAQKVLGKIPEFDPLIRRASKEYELERISKVDKIAIYLAMYEIFENQTDIGLAICEALRLSKKFSVPSAGQYVHAILDTIYKESLNAPAL